MPGFEDFFNPIALGSAAQPPSSLFPTMGTGGVAATPSGMLGGMFGLGHLPPMGMPPNPGVGVGAPPNPGVGDANPVAGPAAGSPGGMNLGSILGKMGQPGFLQAIQSLQKMLGPQQQKPQAISPIPMAQPVGAGVGTQLPDPLKALGGLRLPPGSSGVGIPIPGTMNPGGAGVSGGMGLPGGGGTIGWW